MRKVNSLLAAPMNQVVTGRPVGVGASVAVIAANVGVGLESASDSPVG